MPSENRILSKMLERLFAGLVNGPSLNCRPHSSRQRVDWTLLSRFRDLSPEASLQKLLGDEKSVKLIAKVPPPKRPDESRAENGLTPEEKSARQAWLDQSSLLAKLRGIAEDARTYEQDTGVHVLNIGFPLLSLPPQAQSGKSRSPGKRIIAPIAFIPVTLLLKSGAAPSATIACKEEGVDRVTPNIALLAWLEQQTGKPPAAELFAAEEGTHPWQEISELVHHVCQTLETPTPREFAPKVPDSPSTQASVPAPEIAHDIETAPTSPPSSLTLIPAPRAEETHDKPTILLSAVLGLFPVANQGLLRDMQALNSGEAVTGPITPFIHAAVSLDAAPDSPTADQPPAQPIARKTRDFAQERLIAQADPCQSRAVKLARTSRGLVIHGPPGTGKSQTITNIIGDHLSRSQRVLLVSDKRTALDVVANRLQHMGLGRLVALIHDPQRDQRDLYRAIREQLESLAETTTNPKAEKQLAKVDSELQELHNELTGYWDALMRESDAGATVPPANSNCGAGVPPANSNCGAGVPPASSKSSNETPAHLPDSFHTLVGQWLATGDSPESAALENLKQSLPLHELDHHAHLIEEIFTRAAKVEWWQNPWRQAAGIELATLLATPTDKWRQDMLKSVEAANAADAAIDPAIPPFVPQIDLQQQAAARSDLAERINHAITHIAADIRKQWSRKDQITLSRTRTKLVQVEPQLQTLRAAPLDTELAMTARERLPNMSDLARQLGALESYLAIAGKWHAFLQFKAKSAARQVLAQFGLPLSADSATRLRQFLTGLRARLVLQALHYELYEVPPTAGLLSDETLDRTLSEHRELLDLLAHVAAAPALVPLTPQIIAALNDDSAAANLLQGLRLSPARAEAILSLQQSLSATRLFAAAWLNEFDAAQRNHQPAQPTIDTLASKVQEIESILRIRAALAKIPEAIRTAIDKLLATPIDPSAAVSALRKSALAAEITRRLAADPRLQNVDGQRITGVFDRYRKLENQKRDLVREVILHQWTSRQKERLLSSTGTRLGPMGAELKRRMTLRGERAMRLRQVLAAGQKTEGGDPLFDICPVWMASPETVAQLFARKEVFSVIIFDEASQCRLEETLSVLTRGQRVVIAGDPKQLPPTRFFESAIAQSEDDDEIETDQQLFEAHQSEIEDLLGAALNLEIEQCYLDVHYRSQSAELIQFSNQHFYSRRLQPIPGHPSNKPPGPPLILHRASGIYDKRQNHAEAAKVVEIVRELLDAKDPPSIGIACFNLQQRDLIVEKLDDLAVEDDRFARQLAQARTRQGKGSFEGLFVKNLENVQGDERDQIIISTTYGPDPSGRFYRRFGPLGRAGGGRRLNVLVTRSRQAVHLVTSIPEEIYRALPPIPEGQNPTGGWLLFAYLKYAQDVGDAYAKESSELRVQGSGEERGTETLSSPRSSILNPPSSPSHLNPEPSTPNPAPIQKHPTRTPSIFCEALADSLADNHQIASQLYWGNDGFMVDLALQHPHKPDDVTLGLLCDASRFQNVEDPVEWDVFRTAIHESQGWNLVRIWTPHFFRDPKGVTTAIVRDAI